LIQEPEDDGERTETDDGERTDTDDETKEDRRLKERCARDGKIYVPGYERRVWVKAHCRSKKRTKAEKKEECKEFLDANKSKKKKKKVAKKKPAPVKGISDAELKARMEANAKRQQSRMDSIINRIESKQGIWSDSSAAAQWEV